jgi:hypothetical protein
MDTLALIIVSFLLTTVLGGLLSTYLQWRTWDHQRKVNLSDRELQKADAVCRQVSNLQDKLLYRMLRLYHCLRSADGSDATKITEAQLKNYDETLFEWNDQRNVSLALVGAYFGQDARSLHRQIHELCQLAENELDAMYKHVMQHSPLTFDISNLERHLSELNELTYRLGVFMMIQIRSGQVGRTAPNPVTPQASPVLIADPPMTLPGITPCGL